MGPISTISSTFFYKLFSYYRFVIHLFNATRKKEKFAVLILPAWQAALKRPVQMQPLYSII